MNNSVRSIDGIDLVEAGFAGLFRLLLRNRILLVACFIIGTGAGLGFGLLLPKQYEAQATLIASSQLGDGSGLSGVGRLAAAASNFGLNLPAGDADPSFLFPWILRNREVSNAILLAEYENRNGEPTRLYDVLNRAASDSTVGLARARERLHSEVLRYEKDRKSGVSQLKVRMTDPVLAANVVNRCLEELDHFYQGVKARLAGGEYGFIAARLEYVKDELEAAEARLLDFRESNRDILSSPALILAEGRLIRDVELNQQLFLTLHTQMEIVRIDQEKRLPVLTVLDAGAPPVDPVSPRPLQMAVIWGLLAWVIGVAWCIFRNVARLGTPL